MARVKIMLTSNNMGDATEDDYDRCGRYGAGPDVDEINVLDVDPCGEIESAVRAGMQRPWDLWCDERY